MADDWFRRKTWSQADRDAFFARLSRSRGTFHKSQYLRIQALEISESRTSEGFAAALELVEVLLKDYPDPSQLADAYLIRANCLKSSGDLPGAVAAYRQAFVAQRAYPNLRTTAHLSFAWLVATTPFPDLYREALSALEEFGASDGFLPASRYRSSGAQALIQHGLGDREAARHWARAALQAAEAEHSGLRFHPRVGLVESTDREVHARLTAIAMASP